MTDAYLMNTFTGLERLMQKMGLTQKKESYQLYFPEEEALVGYFVNTNLASSKKMFIKILDINEKKEFDSLVTKGKFVRNLDSSLTRWKYTIDNSDYKEKTIILD